MAKPIMMKNPQNGVMQKGFYGFSWTYLFFGWFVPLFRGELGVAALHLLFTFFTLGFWQLVVCFLYNKQYMGRMLAAGFKFADRPEVNMAAGVALGFDTSLASLSPVA